MAFATINLDQLASSFACLTIQSTSVETIQPTHLPKLAEPKFGFNDYAERLNGRAAMLGFVLALIIEYATGKSILTWLGLT